LFIFVKTKGFMGIEDLISGFKQLSSEQQHEVVNELFRHLVHGEIGDSSVKTESDKLLGEKCPHCGSKSYFANGRLKGVQRFRCKGCGKYFNESTGTALGGLHKKDKFSKYLWCMFMGYSIRKCASETGISIPTSFNWRHKVLGSLSGISDEDFRFVCESDDVFFLHSEKGNRHIDRKPRHRGGKAKTAGITRDHVAVIVTCDRVGSQAMQVSGRGRIRRKDVEKALSGKIRKDTVFCTDAHRSYSAFAKTQELEHHKIKVGSRGYTKDQVYHVQTVNSKVSRLKTWIRDFNGVSTKYLQNYLNWFITLEKLRDKALPLKTFSLLATARVILLPELKIALLNHSYI